MDPCDKHRSINSRSIEEYSLLNYFGYTLYMPLYLSGPILSFNHYSSQLKHKPSSLTTQHIVIYGLRVLGIVLLMETLMHCFYVVAIQHIKTWHIYSPFELIAINFWSIVLVWLKVCLHYFTIFIHHDHDHHRFS